ncbi:hypothetical protein ACOMHN_002553 [Nucella lapillus]
MLTTVGDGTDLLWWGSSARSDREDVTNASVTLRHHVNVLTENDLDSIVSNEDFQTASKVIECGVIPTLGLLGLPANVLNMLVFYRQGLRDKMNLCLFVLAFVDFMFLLCLFLSTFYCPAIFFPDSVMVQILKWNTQKWTLSFRYAFWYSSGTLTAIIATERCICVVWPLKSAAIFSTKSMACMISGIIVVINLLCLPYALKHVVRMETDDRGETRVLYDDTDLYVHHKLAFLIVRDGILSSISFLTFLVVSFVTVVTVRKLKTAMVWRQKTSSQVMDRRQMTLVNILVTVSCCYIACNIPKLSLAVVRFVMDDFSTLGRYRNLFFVTHRAGFALLMLNSSINILIYYRQSSRFRNELHASVCCLRNQFEKNTESEHTQRVVR